MFSDTTSRSLCCFFYSRFDVKMQLSCQLQNNLICSVNSLESAIQSQFIPPITGQVPPGEQVQEVLTLLGDIEPNQYGQGTAHCFTTK